MPPGTITLIGSGEMSPSMGRVHRAVISRITGPVQAVFLDTPAGFQLNTDAISADAVHYFRRYLDQSLSIVSFKAVATATPAEVKRALRGLRRANYIFAGPGSPTYTVRNWRGTAIQDTLARRLASGAHVVFASAAAIAVGRYVLPVYEIYKVGEEPRWVEGLDLLSPYGLELAIVPHWNNSEGGAHDTRYCFIGEPRMQALERMLPDSANILGIDEYTACILDLSRAECQVLGAGQVTIRQKGREDRKFPAGGSFVLGELKLTAPKSQTCLEAAGTGSADWLDAPEDDVEDTAPLVDLLVSIRARLRAARQWALADEIRDRLAELGIVLEDGPAETTWRRTDTR